MKVGTLVVAMALALPAAAVRAEPVALSGDGVRQAVSGKTVFLNISGFELPINYSANGRMSGKMGAVAASFARGDGGAGSRQMVGGGRPAVPAMVELDGRQVLLLPPDSRGREGELGPQRRPFGHGAHR